MRILVLPLAATCALALAACGSDAHEAPAAGEPAADTDGTLPGNQDETAPFAEIAADEVLRFTGTEPFWGGEVAGRTLSYSTPEDQDGEVIMVERFAGRGGLSYSGLLRGAAFEMAVTPARCSDGMSDRTYPLAVTLRIGEETRTGCAWSERHPFEGPAHP